MTIKGRYIEENDFITVYTDEGEIYTINPITGDWGCTKVGNRAFTILHTLTQGVFDQLRKECKHTGTFELRDHKA